MGLGAGIVLLALARSSFTPKTIFFSLPFAFFYFSASLLLLPLFRVCVCVLVPLLIHGRQGGNGNQMAIASCHITTQKKGPSLLLLPTPRAPTLICATGSKGGSSSVPLRSFAFQFRFQVPYSRADRIGVLESLAFFVVVVVAAVNSCPGIRIDSTSAAK